MTTTGNSGNPGNSGCYADFALLRKDLKAIPGSPWLRPDGQPNARVHPCARVCPRSVIQGSSLICEGAKVVDSILVDTRVEGTGCVVKCELRQCTVIGTIRDHYGNDQVIR